MTFRGVFTPYLYIILKQREEARRKRREGRRASTDPNADAQEPESPKVQFVVNHFSLMIFIERNSKRKNRIDR